MWIRLINAALGIWLMAAPDVLQYSAPARTNDRIVGPIAATFAIIAIWEVTRGLRWVNVPLGVWLVVAPLILGYAQTGAIINSLIVGVVLASMAMLGGSVSKQFGGGWSALWRSNAETEA